MYKIKPLKNICKIINVPPDKSISHRALIFSSLCKGKTLIKPFLHSDDTMATLDCMRELGVQAKLNKDSSLLIKGRGIYFSKKEKVVLFAKESGTTMRILSGLLCAQKFPIEFIAAAALSRRPMKRIIMPLSQMNANIDGVHRQLKTKDIYPPLHIKPVDFLNGQKFLLAVASAQIKSALIFAGLYAKGITVISEPFKSRDHTERMLKMFKGRINVNGNKITCWPVARLVTPKKIFIPGDFSSAAFFIVLGLILKDSQIVIKKVNINPTRLGLFNVLKRMGAKIEIKNKVNDYEPYADIVVKNSQLQGVLVEEKEIPLMVDEVPILCVAAGLAKGRTEIRGIGELRVKETDRIFSMVSNLKKAGVNIKSIGDKIVIVGADDYKAARFLSYSDHRTAMSMIVFAMGLNGISEIDNVKCINKSFPEFTKIIQSLY